MKKRTRPDLTRPREGDYLHIKVPENRHLATGLYTARIESLAAKGKRLVCKCSVVLNDLPREDENALLVFFQLTVFYHQQLTGVCFLGGDQFPVDYKHEPNLERRLRESLTIPIERPRYADN